MKIKNNYDCEKCLNKSICKYYDECKLNSNKDLFVKNKGKGKDLTENLVLSITCKHYKTEENTLNYPYGVRDLGNITAPYINTNIETPEPYFDPNSSIGPYSNPNITISNNTNLGKSYEVIDKGDGIGYATDLKSCACSEHLSSNYNGSESSKNLSKIITTKKHI